MCLHAPPPPPPPSYSAYAPLGLQNAILVSSAFAVIATAFAVFNCIASLIALFNASFASAGDLIKDTTSRSISLNFLSAAAWVISWATYIWFNGMLVTSINELFMQTGVAAGRTESIFGVYGNAFTGGFALAVISSGLAFIVAVLGWSGAVAPLAAAAPGYGSPTGQRLSIAAFFAIGAFATAVAAMVTPWAVQWAAVDPRAGAGNFVTHEFGLYTYEICRSFASAESWSPSYFASPAPVGLDCEVVTPTEYATSQYFLGSQASRNSALDYSTTVGAFQAAVVGVAAIGVYVLLAVANAAAAGHTAVFGCQSLFAYNVTTAFWVFVAATLFSTFTWPIYAALAWYTLPAPADSEPVVYWAFSAGFVLSIIAGILSYFTVVALYLALTLERAAPGLADFAVNFVTPWVKRSDYVPVAKAEAPASAPKAAAARIASMRSAVIATIIASCGIAALFGVWETQTITQQSVGAMWSASYGLLHYEECDVNNFVYGDYLTRNGTAGGSNYIGLQCEVRQWGWGGRGRRGFHECMKAAGYRLLSTLPLTPTPLPPLAVLPRQRVPRLDV